MAKCDDDSRSSQNVIKCSQGSKLLSQRESRSCEEPPRPKVQAPALSNETRPSNRPSPSPKHESPKANPALQSLDERVLADKVAALKDRLTWDSTHCGAPTKKDTPCKNPTPPRNNGQIASLLRSLADATQSSEGLESELEDLSRFIHCRWHSCGTPSDSRVDAWLETFPKGELRGKSPILVARKIRRALGGVSSQCAGVAKAGNRCSRHIGGQKVQNCSKSIAEVVILDALFDKALIELHLSVLETNRYCHQHLSQVSMLNVDQGVANLLNIRREGVEANTSGSGLSPVTVSANGAQDATTQMTTYPELQDKIEMMLRDRIQSSAMIPPNQLPWPTAALAAFWSPCLDVTPLNIVSSTDDKAHEESFYPSVYDVAVRCLDTKDQKSGYVYLYEVESNPGLVKIGYTTRSIDERHEEWGFQCNRKVNILYPTRTDQPERVPNARRIEALCHAELDKLRVRVLCHGCVKQHIEWFEIEVELAIASIRKWTSWMKTEPYQKGPKQYGLSSRWQKLIGDRDDVGQLDDAMSSFANDGKRGTRLRT